MLFRSLPAPFLFNFSQIKKRHCVKDSGGSSIRLLYAMPFCYHTLVAYKNSRPAPWKSRPAIITLSYGKPITDYIAMITVLIRDCNQISQSVYDFFVNSIQLHQLSCSCGHAGCLHVHGYYLRGIKHPEGLALIRICRVRCSLCGTTHSILLSSMIPYSRISMEDQRQICITYDDGGSPSVICDQNPSIDENNVKTVRRNYLRRWREMLRSLSIDIHNSSELILRCFADYSAQFMQIRRGANLLFVPTT